jgi:hypothetical protein
MQAGWQNNPCSKVFVVESFFALVEYFLGDCNKVSLLYFLGRKYSKSIYTFDNPLLLTQVFQVLEQEQSLDNEK